MTCLVIGDAVLGAEVRSGTFAFTWMSPVPTWQIAVGRWLGGTHRRRRARWPIAFALAAVVAGAPESAGAGRRSRPSFGAEAYVAVFIAIGVHHQAGRRVVARLRVPRRAAARRGARPASPSSAPSWEARAAFIGLSDVRADLVREGIPHGTGALVRLCLITAVALVLASWRLRTLKLTGSSD